MTSDSGASFRRLFQPRSVAIVGVSPEPGSIGGAVLTNLKSFEYPGEIHLVSRSRHEVDGRASVGSIEELPRDIDAAVLCVPAVAILDSLRSCAHRGIGAAVIYAAGFAEVGAEGRLMQDNLARQARESGILINGPNCLGFANLCDRIPLTYEPLKPVSLAGLPLVGILSQSGAIASSLRNAFLQKQIGVSHVVSTGNEATLGLEDFLAFLVDDGRAAVIAIFAEHIRNPQKFLRIVSEAQSKGMPIVMLHPGRSERARASAASHTGALAGDHAIMATLVRQKGVVLVETMEELVDTAEMLSRFRESPGGGVAVVTNSGAFKGFALDFCESIDLKLAELSTETVTQLKKAVPPFATVDNPLDVTGQVIKEPKILTNTTGPLLAEASVGGLLVAVVPGGSKQATDKADAVIASMANSNKPVAFAVMGDEVVLPDGFGERLRRANIPFFRSPERALRALAHVGRHGRSRANSESRGRGFDLPPIVLPGPGIAPEYVGKKILSQIGIVTPKGGLAVDIVQAERIAGEIGYPVVLKAQSSALAHKSEAGGVQIGISDESALQRGWKVLNANVRTANADLVLDGILVETMVPTDVEFMIGAKRDPQWGVVLMVGLGGVWVEVMGDVQLLPPGLSSSEIRRRIMLLRSSALLREFRGKPARDVDVLIDVIQRVDALMAAYPEIAEIDINPIVLNSKNLGAVALDALIMIGEK